MCMEFAYPALSNTSRCGCSRSVSREGLECLPNQTGCSRAAGFRGMRTVSSESLFQKLVVTALCMKKALTRKARRKIRRRVAQVTVKSAGAR